MKPPYSLLTGFTKPDVDNAAHLGGLIAGGLLGLMLPTRLRQEQQAQMVPVRTLLNLVVMGALLAWTASNAPLAQVNMKSQIQAQKEVSSIALEFDKVVKAIQQDALDTKAGRMSDLEMDERSRSVHAIRMRSVLDKLNALNIDSGHPLTAFVDDLQGLSQALNDYLSMDSILVDGKPQPVDLAKGKHLEADIKKFNDRLLTYQNRRQNQRSAEGG